MLKDPEAEVNKKTLQGFDEAFTAYHDLLLKLKPIIKPGRMLSSNEIREAYFSADKFENLLKGYFSKDIYGIFNTFTIFLNNLR